MLYFNSNSQDKKLPKKGSVIYLIPCRYWETKDYRPEKFTVNESKIEGDGRLSLYGQFEKEKPNTPMYAAIDCDCEWYWTYRAARAAQKLFAQLQEIISRDDGMHYIRPLVRNMLKKKTVKESLK